MRLLCQSVPHVGAPPDGVAALLHPQCTAWTRKRTKAFTMAKGNAPSAAGGTDSAKHNGGVLLHAPVQLRGLGPTLGQADCAKALAHTGRVRTA